MYAEASLGLATAVAPLIGYAAAAEVAEESRRTNRPLTAILRERGILDEATLSRLLDPATLTEPGRPGR
jgi:aspartate ammonia-lyase